MTPWPGLFCVLNFVAGLQAVAPIKTARAEEAIQHLTRRVEGESFRARLIAIDATERLSLQAADGTLRDLQLDDLLMWGHPMEIERGPIVVIQDESLVQAGAITFADGHFVLGRSSSQRLTVPAYGVRAIQFVPFGATKDWGGGIDESPQSNELGDRVLLRNRDAFSGRITELTANSVHITSRGSPFVIQRTRVAGAFFGASVKASVTETAGDGDRRLLVGLRDGSLLRARKLESDNGVLSITLMQGLTLPGVSADDICYLQPLGRRVEYLSDLPVADYTYHPYWGIDWPLKVDRNVQGGPLRTSSGIYAKGLGMRSGSVATYAVDPQYDRFEAELALDQRCGVRGSVRIQVDLREGDKWLPAYTSGVLRGGMKPESVAVGLDGATKIRLRVDSADHGDAWDLANWLNARFVR